MGYVADLQPLNLLEEKQKVVSDNNYNPRFEYRREFSEVELTRWGKPSEKYYQFARARLKSGGGRNERMGENYLSQGEIVSRIRDLVTGLGLGKLEVKFGENQVAKITMTNESVIFRWPIKVSLDQLESWLRHEVQTHWLRRVNELEQPWKDELRKDEQFRMTEEGLANLNEHIFEADPFLEKSYRSYEAVYLAQEHSFAWILEWFLNQGFGFERAFYKTLQVKRGLKDTSQPGGITKSKVYLEGAVGVWNWIVNNDGNPKDLYWGRIGIEEVNSLRKRAVKEVKLPLFLADEEVYLEKLNRLAEINRFEELI